MTGRSSVSSVVISVAVAVTLTSCGYSPSGSAKRDNIRLAEQGARMSVPQFKSRLSALLADAKSAEQALADTETLMGPASTIPFRLVRGSEFSGDDLHLSMIFYSFSYSSTFSYSGTDIAEICADFTGTIGAPGSVKSMQVICPEVPPEGGLPTEELSSVLKP